LGALSGKEAENMALPLARVGSAHAVEFFGKLLVQEPMGWIALQGPLPYTDGIVGLPVGEQNPAKLEMRIGQRTVPRTDKCVL
jgi:hypothetical protein